jgi:hypothetical protein
MTIAATSMSAGSRATLRPLSDAYYGREKFRTVSCGDHQKMSSLNILAEHLARFHKPP